MKTARIENDEGGGGEASAPSTRNRILDVSEELFASRGFAGTAVRDIARQAGLTPASLYNHFENKQALYEAVLERGVRPLLQLMVGLQAADDRDEVFDQLIEGVMAHLARRPHLPGLVQHETITGGSVMARVARTWIRPVLDQAMLRMKRQGDSLWTEEEYSHVITAWLQIIFGYFSMAPMYQEIFDQDPLAPENLARQTRFLRKLVRLMMMGASAPRISDLTGD